MPADSSETVTLELVDSQLESVGESIQLLDIKSYIEFYVYVHVACLSPTCFHALQPTTCSFSLFPSIGYSWLLPTLLPPSPDTNLLQKITLIAVCV